jgi:hypothetical protein
MRMKRNNGNRGIVKTIVIIVIAFLILSYYGFDLRKSVESPTTKSNFAYATSAVVYVWDNYLKAPATKVYNLFINMILTHSIAELQNIKLGQLPTVNVQSYLQFPTAPSTQ